MPKGKRQMLFASMCCFIVSLAMMIWGSYNGDPVLIVGSYIEFSLGIVSLLYVRWVDHANGKTSKIFEYMGW